MTRFYQELADWWPLFSAPADYREEADDLVARLALGAARARSPRCSSSAPAAGTSPRTSPIASR